MINLVSNAVKFTDKGSIDVILTLPIVTPEHTSINIDILDTGLGISKEEIAYLFERFSQGSSAAMSAQKYTGSGLGLYFSKQMARMMGGDIVVKSIQGQGSVFSITLQFDTPSLQEKKEIADPTKKEVEVTLSQLSLFSQPIQPFTKRTILIVDDNMINQKILLRILKGAGHVCHVANDGLEALSLYDKFWFDLILMDILMPKMDGLTATKEIRKREKEGNFPKTPIFAITANALARDKEEGFAVGIDDYLTKPFSREELLEKIKALESVSHATPELK